MASDGPRATRMAGDGPVRLALFSLCFTALPCDPYPLVLKGGRSIGLTLACGIVVGSWWPWLWLWLRAHRARMS